MTNGKMLDIIAKLQTYALRSGHNKEHARMLFWLVGDAAWELMCARGINGVDYEEFQSKQKLLFESGWNMVNGKEEADEDPWIKELKDSSEIIDILNADVIE